MTSGLPQVPGVNHQLGRVPYGIPKAIVGTKAPKFFSMTLYIKQKLRMILREILGNLPRIRMSNFTDRNGSGGRDTRPIAQVEILISYVGSEYEEVDYDRYMPSEQRSSSYSRTYKVQLEISLKNVREVDELEFLADYIGDSIGRYQIFNAPIIPIADEPQPYEEKNGRWVHILELGVTLDNRDRSDCPTTGADDYTFDEMWIDIVPRNEEDLRTRIAVILAEDLESGQAMMVVVEPDQNNEQPPDPPETGV